MSATIEQRSERVTAMQGVPYVDAILNRFPSEMDGGTFLQREALLVAHGHRMGRAPRHRSSVCNDRTSYGQLSVNGNEPNAPSHPHIMRPRPEQRHTWLYTATFSKVKKEKRHGGVSFSKWTPACMLPTDQTPAIIILLPSRLIAGV